MAEFIPHFTVKNGKHAVETYKELFGAEIVSPNQPFQKEMGAQMGFPADFDYENSTMHVELSIKGLKIFLADPPGDFQSPDRLELILNLESKAEVEEIYNKALEMNAKILMKYSKTFWGAYYTRFIDPEGIGWQLNYNIPEGSEE